MLPCLALLALALPLQDTVDDAALRKAWKRLSGDQQREVAEWFGAEVLQLDLLQNRLIRAALDASGRDPYSWPAVERAPTYDPQRHAPAQPIPRKWLSERSSKAKREKQAVFGPVRPRRLDPGWTYDYGLCEVRRTGELEDPERTFANGLAGFAPRLDLAEALVERRLDGGALQTLFAALDHAYADREGNVYPGITIYDAWASGREIEMPDVECLGIVHDVLGDWSTWTAPIPAAEHERLYARIRELYVEARSFRGHTSSLARTHLIAEPVLRDGLQPHVGRLHALWASLASDPAALAELLPETDWEEWIAAQGARLDNDKKLWTAGEARKRELARGEAEVRSTLVRVMREFGALDG